MQKQIYVGIGVVILCVIGVFLINKWDESFNERASNFRINQFTSPPQPSPIDSQEIPIQKTLINDYHVFQSYNNCGPAALSMGLSYFQINISQEELGDDLRPYRPLPGNNDDKSVTLEEMGDKAEEYGMKYFHRPHGTLEKLEQFIAADIPVITRTWLHPDEDIGHYRVVKGYDQNEKVIIQDDSYEGPNLSYEYEVFNDMWEKFNYEYLVIYPPEKQSQVEEIIGEDVKKEVAWQNAKEHAENMLKDNPSDIYARFNLSIALYHLGQYDESIKQYEQVSGDLPFRTLWYQIEPIDAYFQVGKYERVFEITQNIFENGNRAYAEAYVIRGRSFEAMGQSESAQVQYQHALKYNKNLLEAQERLDSL